MRQTFRYRSLAVLVAIVVTGCVIIPHWSTRVDPLDRHRAGVVASPVKAHLLDGSTVLFRNGIIVSRDTVVGRLPGVRFDLTLRDSTRTTHVPLDSVVGLESFRTETDAASTVLTSLFASALTTGIVAAGALVAFGSCPTVYTTDDSGELLEAELFSYSIAPLLESRDMDVLHTHADAAGAVVLDVRNEALETHFINHTELLEVVHSQNETVVPDPHGQPLVVGPLMPPARAIDAQGRDVRRALGAADGEVFASDTLRLAAASESSFRDHIDMAFPVPAARDSATIVFLLRNSLLNTVLFYDAMLAAQGAAALDWQGTNMDRVGPAVQLGSWYVSRMGLRIHVADHGVWRDVGRVPDSGPIAWKRVAVRVPVFDRDSLRVRSSFVTDAWRIDRVGVAFESRRATPRAIKPAAATTAQGSALPDVLGRLAVPDDRYVQTGPGDRFLLRFETGAEPPNAMRTFLLAAQGYYTEWIRPAWIRSAAVSRPFEASDRSLVDVMHSWLDVRTDFEKRFYATRIPTR
ncbi:MAG: hypothetical protein L0271_06155 [Gemmatimonadetes bacterium]|nr:hypothetical protein [Gemmatimonadota bacterium]